MAFSTPAVLVLVEIIILIFKMETVQSRGTDVACHIGPQCSPVLMAPL
jgi:hypothetical protein